MTQRQRRQSPPTTAETTETPTATEPTAPAPAPAPSSDRLSVLRYYAGRDGLLPVFVAVSHDAVFAGQHLRMPVTDRVAGLVEIGFLEVELPEPGDE
jgi:hypothetical protein